MERRVHCNRREHDLKKRSHEFAPIDTANEARYQTEQQQRLQKVANAAEHLLSVINNVLDFSKIEAGKVSLEQREFTVDQVLDNIANMTTQTQVALSRARTPEEYREVLYSNAEEFDRLARMTSDMLFLAKADNGLIVPRSEAFDLRNEVRELFEFYDAFAEERGVRLTVTGEATARGERLMIRRAIGTPPTGSAGLARTRVRGRSRVPRPAVSSRAWVTGGTGRRLSVRTPCGRPAARRAAGRRARRVNDTTRPRSPPGPGRAGRPSR